MCGPAPSFAAYNCSWRGLSNSPRSIVRPDTEDTNNSEELADLRSARQTGFESCVRMDPDRVEAPLRSAIAADNDGMSRSENDIPTLV